MTCPVAGRCTRGAESGVVTVLGIALVALIATVALAGAAVVGILDAHRRAESAADLAALAGGGAVAGGRDPCAAADAVARRNGAQLEQCDPQGLTVAVVVTVPGPRLLGLLSPLSARARAGPVTPVALAPR